MTVRPDNNDNDKNTLCPDEKQKQIYTNFKYYRST